jgi:5-methylcytosine-specific restriction endonuclease McrA
VSKAWSAGSTTAWRKVRPVILSRDAYRCQIRGPKCTGRATQVDHIVPKSRGGSDDPSNLQAACQPCNGSMGDRPRNPEPRLIMRF